MKALKLEFGATKREPINPIDIFRLLPRKDPKYTYLWDVQSDVLKQWYELRDQNELVIKMNTGSGKTLVSLLILQSYLNQRKGPVVYVVPDNYLLSQVSAEAKKLGINITENPDADFLRQRAIFIVNIHRLFNSKSIFGVNSVSGNQAGVFLIDDAHACIDKLEEQFTIIISTKKQKQKYDQLLSIFAHALDAQSQATFVDITAGRPDALLQVPFWVIQEHVTDIYKILSKEIDEDDENKWKLELVKNYICFCDCVVSGNEIEFSLPSIPTETIPTFYGAKKVIVSATLPDDSILNSSLGISEQALDKPIVPTSGGDLGERLIIIPEEFVSEFDKDAFKSIMLEYSKSVKVVIIVPSSPIASYWSDVADFVIYAENIAESLSQFREMDTGIAVLVNKYDGIDLPNDDCRILVIDELPDDRSLKEKIDSTVLVNNKAVEIRRIRKIEQGMGRATRSLEDYSVVFLIGKNLVKTLYVSDGESAFTAATRKQLNYSRAVLHPFENSEIDEIRNAINEVLVTRSDEWVTGIRSILLELDDHKEYKNTINTAIASAMESARKYNYTEAGKKLEEARNTIDSSSEKGYLGYYLASIKNFTNKTDAQEILKSSSCFNPRIVRPIAGVEYSKIIAKTSKQAENCRDYFSKFLTKPNSIFLHLDSTLEDLVFMPGTSEPFESAIHEIGKMIGLTTQRPEKEIGKGPDNLWVSQNQEYFVIECKNGCDSTSQLICKQDANQMNGSILWFEEKYPDVEKEFPLLIHPYSTLSYEATLQSAVRIMDIERLLKFKLAVKDFVLTSNAGGRVANITSIQNSLIRNKLLSESLIDAYSINYRLQRKSSPRSQLL